MSTPPLKSISMNAQFISKILKSLHNFKSASVYQMLSLVNILEINVLFELPFTFQKGCIHLCCALYIKTLAHMKNNQFML